MSEYRTHLLESVAALRDAASRLADTLQGEGLSAAAEKSEGLAARDAEMAHDRATSPAPSAPAARLRLQEVLRHGVRTGRYVLAVPGAIVTLNQSETLALPLEVVEAAALAEAELKLSNWRQTYDLLTREVASLRAKLAAAERERDEAREYRGLAATWCAVFDALKVIKPQFTNAPKTGTECAVDAIKELAQERDAARQNFDTERKRVHELVESNATLTNERDAARQNSRMNHERTLRQIDYSIALRRVIEWLGRGGNAQDAPDRTLCDHHYRIAEGVAARLHPVATRETVERMAEAIDEAASNTHSLREMARAALSAAGFTLEGET